MCLLIHKPADVTFTDDWLKDFYTRNKDGYGVMYAKDGKLHYEKELGSVQDWIAFFRKHEHREACFHLRMRTHGDIDLENCHPYPVFGYDFGDAEDPMLLMHNGVLHTGNDGDVSKSDTWHYIRNYIRPLVKGDQGMIHQAYFQEIIGKHIGSNRFAMMDVTGKAVIINRAQGVTWNGAWFSNTYAWSAQKAMPPKPAPQQPYYSSWDNWNNWKGKKSHVNPVPVKSKRAPASKYDGNEAEMLEVQALADELLMADADLYETITVTKLHRLLKDLGSYAAWEWVQAFSYGDISRVEFMAGVDDPRKAKEFLNQPKEVLKRA